MVRHLALELAQPPRRELRQHLPLCGIVSAITTSNALTRSVATSRTRFVVYLIHIAHLAATKEA